jgi:hypothetical protein
MKSKFLECVQCDAIFEFSAKEQERCEMMGFDEPRRCPECRKRKSRDDEAPGWKNARGKKRHHRSRGSEDTNYETV